MSKRRLIRSQLMTDQTVTPEQEVAIHHLLDNLSHVIEQNYYQTIKNKIKFEDLFPTTLEQNIEQQTGIQDLHRIINFPELIRKVNEEITRDKSIYDMVKKYLTEAYDRWADRPY